MTQVFGIVPVILLIVIVAAIVVLFWLAITAIRALNVYIAKNRVQSTDLQ